MKIRIIDLSKQIEDPKMDRKNIYKMETILYASIAAVIREAESGNEIKGCGDVNLVSSKVEYRIGNLFPLMIPLIHFLAL